MWVGTDVLQWPGNKTLTPTFERVKKYVSAYSDSHFHWRLVDHTMTDEVCTEVWQGRDLCGV